MTDLTWKILLQKYNQGEEDYNFILYLPNGNSLGVFDDGEVRLRVNHSGLNMSVSLGYYDNFSDIDCLIQMMLRGKEDA